MANNIILAGLRRAVLNPGIAAIQTVETSADVHSLVTSASGASGGAIGSSQLVAAAFNTVPPTVTNGQIANMQSDAQGNLRTTLTSGSGSTGADAVSNAALFQVEGNAVQSTVLRPLAVANWVFNGTTFDRQRSIINAVDSTGTGIAAVGLTGQLDDTAPNTVTENQFGALRISPSRALLVEEGPFTATRVIADGSIKASAGFIHTISISPTGLPVAGVVTIYDNTAESGTVLFSMSVPAAVFSPVCIILDARAATGIFVGFDAALTNTQVTVSFR